MLMVEMNYEQKRLLDEEEAGSDTSDQNNKNSDNHHTIPRKDYGKYIGNNDSDGNGSG